MELIKKHYRQIISFSFIFLGLCFVALFFITKPSKTNNAEITKYTSTSSLTDISFPYSVKLPALSTKPAYLTLYFGDDSINEHDYQVTISSDSDTLFEHTYTDEISNIIVFTLDDTKDYTGQDLELKITCLDKCKDVKLKLYDTESGQLPKIIATSNSSDYRYLWFAFFLLIIGFTLLPLSKETKK